MTLGPGGNLDLGSFSCYITMTATKMQTRIIKCRQESSDSRPQKRNHQVSFLGRSVSWFLGLGLRTANYNVVCNTSSYKISSLILEHTVIPSPLPPCLSDLEIEPVVWSWCLTKLRQDSWALLTGKPTPKNPRLWTLLLLLLLLLTGQLLPEYNTQYTSSSSVYHLFADDSKGDSRIRIMLGFIIRMNPFASFISQGFKASLTFF